MPWKIIRNEKGEKIGYENEQSGKMIEGNFTLSGLPGDPFAHTLKSEEKKKKRIKIRRRIVKEPKTAEEEEASN